MADLSALHHYPDEPDPIAIAAAMRELMNGYAEDSTPRISPWPAD